MIYGWEFALGIIALCLAISVVQGVGRRLRGGSLLPNDTFKDRRTSRYWRDSDGAIEEAIVPRPEMGVGMVKVVLAVVAVIVGCVITIKFWEL